MTKTFVKVAQMTKVRSNVWSRSCYATVIMEFGHITVIKIVDNGNA